jgi:serine/threonine protein kinase
MRGILKSSNRPPSPVQDETNLHIDPAKLRLGPQLGQGASAVVYRGTYLGEAVAVKRMRSPALSAAFLDEARTALALRHGAVVSVRGVCCDPDAADRDGAPLGVCIVSQLAAHGSLLDVLRHPARRADLAPWAARLRLLAGAAAGLMYLHGLRPAVLHRDIKPGNVLVAEGLRPLIADFGLSRAAGPGEDAVMGEGTLAYTAPELLDGDPPSTASDVYAFAMVMWVVATAAEGRSPPAGGIEPWPNRNRVQLQNLVLAGKRPPWPEEVVGDEVVQRFIGVSSTNPSSPHPRSLLLRCLPCSLFCESLGTLRQLAS